MQSLQTHIDIVIPNYNGIKFLDPCLKSIALQTYRLFSITLVDNGSKDGSVEFIREHYPDVQLISLSENVGFSAAVNAGVSAGKHPLVFLLNNDTELHADCLAQLVRASTDHEEYAFFAPKMLSFHDRDVLDGAGDGFLRGGVGYRLGTMEKDEEAYNSAGPVFGACGGAALYRRSIFGQIGMFDENFFAYLEDVDLNLRANRAGLRCWYEPTSHVYHIGSATTGSKINEFTVRLSTRNNYYLLLKNYPLTLFIRFLPAICVYQFFWLLFVIKKRQFLAYLSGWLGFFQGLPAVLRTRRNIQSISGGISNGEFAQRILDAERLAINSIMRRRTAEGKGNTLLQTYKRIFL